MIDSIANGGLGVFRTPCSAARTFGIGTFTAGLILSIMILPFISAVTRDVLETVPSVLKEASYGLGATSWEVMWKVCLPFCQTGVVGGAMLALGRALGETMAVTFVIGNAHKNLSASLFAPGTSISATIANEFSEATSELYTSSLIELGLLLFIITFIVLAFAATDVAPDGKAARGRCDMIMPTRALYFRRRLANYGVHSWHVRWAHGPVRPGVAGLSSWARCSRTASPPCRPSLFTEADAAARQRRRSLQRHFRQCGDEPGRCGCWARPSDFLRVLIWRNMPVFGKLAFVVRFVNDILLSAPFYRHRPVHLRSHGGNPYGSLLRPSPGSASSLTVIVIPVVVRTTENMLLLVPNGLA